MLYIIYNSASLDHQSSSQWVEKYQTRIFVGLQFLNSELFIYIKQKVVFNKIKSTYFPDRFKQNLIPRWPLPLIWT